MADDAAERPLPVEEKPSGQSTVLTELIPSQAGQISALGSMHAPIIFTDLVGTYGLDQDFAVANISLEAIRHMPVGDKSIADRVIVAHLRMPLRTLRMLKETIQKIELMASPVPEKAKN